MKVVMDFTSAVLGAICGISIAWLLCFHVEIGATTVRLVYENGDLLHKILQLLNFA